MPEKTLTKISKEKLSSLKMTNNKVLVEITETNEGRTSKGGIILGVNIDIMYGAGEESNVADQGVIHGYVHAIPDKLFFDRDSEDGLPWETELEIEVGDRLVFDYLDALNCDEIEVGDRVFKILDYTSLYVAIRGEDIISLNGYNLLLPCLRKPTSEFDINQETRDFSKGVVKHLAKPNKRYNDINKSDGIELGVGDTVMFTDHYAKNPLFAERYKEYVTLDEQYLICQAFNMIAVL